jgi:hypothetical protein
MPATHLYLQQNFATEPSVEPRQENNEPLMLVQCTFIFRASRENHGSPEGPRRKRPIPQQTKEGYDDAI